MITRARAYIVQPNQHYNNFVIDNDELHLGEVDKHSTFVESKNNDNWQCVLDEKMNSIIGNRILRLVDFSIGHKPIRLKWVFKLKRDVNGKVLKHKARLVAKGFVQH